jgi:hypothetical protein
MAYKMDGNEIAKTRAAFADRNLAFNQLRSAKIDEVQMRAQNIDAQIQAAETEVANALERGDWSAQAAAQRRVSELAARRVAVESEYQRWQSQPVYSHDPVEDLIKSKQSEPLTQQWLRSHESDAVALATGSDPRRVAQIQASHNDAIAEGHEPGSKGYFNHVNKFLDGKSSGATRGSGGGTSGGGAEVRLTANEVRLATDGTLTWNYSDPTGQNRWKKGDALGIQEYARRKKEMKAQGMFERLD